MECRDAINVIKEHLAELHDQYSVYGVWPDGVIHVLEGFAIPAMEKEIDKDIVLKISSAYYGRQYYACPACGDFIRWRFPNETNEYDYKPNRCPFCGQSLNWRE